MQHNFSYILLLFTLLLYPLTGKTQGYRYETAVPLVSGPEPGAPVSMPWMGGLNTVQASLADTDGNGQPELVLFDRSSTQVQVFAQTAEGWVWLPEERFRFPADITNWLLLVDYNGDGRKDLFTYTPAGIRVFKNTAAGGAPASWELDYPLLTYPGNSGSVNLLVNSGDVPLIADTDGDGDVDIASFDPSGSGTIRWYKNVGVEKFGRTDMLAFELADEHWGGVTECHCKTIALDKTPCPSQGGRQAQRPMHAGGKSLLWHDVSGDGIPDLLIGEEECTQLYYLPNSGTAAAPVFAEANVGLPGAAVNPGFKFQAAYALGNDILITSNLKNGGNQLNLQQSLWLYEQQAPGTFALAQKDFLQQQALDAGEEGRPAFFDIDADGDQDLLLGSKGTLQADGNYASLALYENTGTAQAPAFKLKDKDYKGLSAAKYQNLQPQLLDFNKDGAADLLITALDRSAGRVRALVFLNKATAAAPVNFETTPSLELPLQLSTLDYPFYYDVSGDGLPDVLAGRFDGSLRLYTNTGTAAAPAFTLSDEAYKGFALENVRRHLVPTVGDANGDGQPDLVVSDASGGLRILYSFLKSELTAGNAEIISVELGEAEVAPRLGDRSWPALANLWAEELPALAVGQIGGGLVLLRNETPRPRQDGEAFALDVYPNPSKGRPVNIKTNAPAQVRVLSLLGQLVASWHTSGQEALLWEPALPAGLYIVEARFAGARKVKKLIVAP